MPANRSSASEIFNQPCSPEDATLVAFMREAGSLEHIRVSESKDDGLTWGPVKETELPNPGSGIDGIRLTTAIGSRLQRFYQLAIPLAVSLSEDEGRTWKWTRHLEKHAAGRTLPSDHPGHDGNIQVSTVALSSQMLNLPLVRPKRQRSKALNTLSLIRHGFV